MLKSSMLAATRVIFDQIPKSHFALSLIASRAEIGAKTDLANGAL